MTKGMLSPCFPLRVNFLRCCFLILSFKFQLHLLIMQPYNLTSLLCFGTLPIILAFVALPLVFDLIMQLARSPISALIIKSMPLRAEVAILFLVISKMAFAEGALFLVQRLALRRDNNFYPLSVTFFEFIGISTGYITGIVQKFICLIDLPGKLIDITGISDRIGVHN